MSHNPENRALDPTSLRVMLSMQRALIKPEGYERDLRVLSAELNLISNPNDLRMITLLAVQQFMEAQTLAMSDALTGLANRRAFDMAQDVIGREALRAGRPYTLLLLDIDKFKSFNDTYGHDVGDDVLRIVAQRVKHSVRDDDVAARFGGEEIAIILPGTDAAQGAKIAEKIRAFIESSQMTDRNTGAALPRITASIGVAQAHLGESAEDLFKRVDTALYAAKQGGRNRVITAENGTAEYKSDLRADLQR